VSLVCIPAQREKLPGARAWYRVHDPHTSVPTAAACEHCSRFASFRAVVQPRNRAIVLRVHTPCYRVHDPHTSAPTAAACDPPRQMALFQGCCAAQKQGSRVACSHTLLTRPALGVPRHGTDVTRQLHSLTEPRHGGGLVAAAHALAVGQSASPQNGAGNVAHAE
jgi:hypothetical protein